MQTDIYIDPKIDIYSDEYIEVLIEFKIKPAKVAMAISHLGLTMEQAKKQVDMSHQSFQSDLKILDEQQNKYSVIHTYKDSFNGVAMRLKGNAIKHLLKSTAIKAVYKNKEIGLPKKPVDTRYQI
ncbi:protease inhibitor I9 family protein [Virgibacillus sp. MSJ-26]|uniref:protease inhibitor I9 family protein n=1 Tax=Virgibacillus sp. MSJ-26 TaxID=2841522 RepID=UPI001C125020|nr:protease inhibitor I9 family protein [Virgibacillus sp. MSJ-26]MBU5467595.1 protease inhibitor I9 family protein [Virgibacillus sp. MSJ-26]